MRGLVFFFAVVAFAAPAPRHWKGEKTLGAWLVGDVAVAINATELEPKRHFNVSYSATGWIRLLGSFAETDILDVRFNSDIEEGTSRHFAASL